MYHLKYYMFPFSTCYCRNKYCAYKYMRYISILKLFQGITRLFRFPKTESALKIVRTFLSQY